MTNPRDLLQLRALYQAGYLTEDEYTDARRRLLGYKGRRLRPPRPAEAPGATQGGADEPSARSARPPRDNSDLPLLFALAALAIVALLAMIWFLLA